MYPKPDRSDLVPNFKKTAENEELDIGWAEGTLSDGRPYRAECWATSGITMVTIFVSRTGMESMTAPDFRDLLVREGLIKFLDDELNMQAEKFVDPAGNDLWSLNVCIGTEDGLKARDTLAFRPYK